MLRYHLILVFNQSFQIFSKVVFLQSWKSAHFIWLYFFFFFGLFCFFSCISHTRTEASVHLEQSILYFSCHLLVETSQSVYNSTFWIYLVERWDHLSIAEKKHKADSIAYYSKGEQCWSCRSSPSREDHCSYIGFGGRVEFNNWQLFRVISGLTSSVRVWLLGWDCCW